MNTYKVYTVIQKTSLGGRDIWPLLVKILVKILDDSWLSIVPVISNPNIDLFEILWFLVHFRFQQLRDVRRFALV